MGSDTELSTSSLDLDKKSCESLRFKCVYSGCSKAYSRQWKLDSHICSHTKERPFKCEITGCNKDYTSKSHLKRHISVAHMNVNSPPVHITCSYPGCFRTFQNKYSLKKHFKSHLTPSKYRCSECGLDFKKRRQLVVHSTQHKGSLPYICMKCNEGFTCKTGLKNHEKKHKLYVCEYEDCNDSFVFWSLYRKHLKLKHPKSYICSFCNHTYLNKNTLEKHIMKHLDNSCSEAYPCPFADCLKYYKYKRNLNHHIRINHEGKTYNCSEENCTKAFKSKNRLMDHQLKHSSGTLNAPRTTSKIKKIRKTRKDKGVRKTSMASLLSGVHLPREIDQYVMKNIVTPEVEDYIKDTINKLKDIEEDISETDEINTQNSGSLHEIHTSDIDPSQNKCTFIIEAE